MQSYRRQQIRLLAGDDMWGSTWVLVVLGVVATLCAGVTVRDVLRDVRDRGDEDTR